MAKDVINVGGMSCEHCVKAITKAVGGMDGVKTVAVNLGEKTVTVDYDPDKSALLKIKSEIEDQGYEII